MIPLNSYTGRIKSVSNLQNATTGAIDKSNIHQHTQTQKNKSSSALKTANNGAIAKNNCYQYSEKDGVIREFCKDCKDIMGDWGNVNMWAQEKGI